jgi:hypothetical protein
MWGGFGAKKRWLEIRIKSAGFVNILDLARVCLQLASQNLTNKCIEIIFVCQCVFGALKKCNLKLKLF